MSELKTYPLKCHICGCPIGETDNPDTYRLCSICSKRSREKLRDIFMSPEAMDDIKNLGNTIKEDIWVKIGNKNQYYAERIQIDEDEFNKNPN